MVTLTLKLPEILKTQLDHIASKSGLSKSEIVRKALMAYISKDDSHDIGSFMDQSADLAGCLEASPDLSSNKDHLNGYGK